MFMYQNKDGHICVTFKDNKPVTTPEYEFVVDEKADPNDSRIYTVNCEVTPFEPADTPTTEKTPIKVYHPAVEKLDNIDENDAVADVANNNNKVVIDLTVPAPDVDDIRDKFEDEPESTNDASVMGDYKNHNVPTVDELDDIEENDTDGITSTMVDPYTYVSSTESEEIPSEEEVEETEDPEDTGNETV